MNEKIRLQLPKAILHPSGRVIQVENMTEKEAGEMVDGIDRTLRILQVQQRQLEKEISDVQHDRDNYRDLWLELGRKGAKTSESTT